jgi:hypothetical protein
LKEKHRAETLGTQLHGKGILTGLSGAALPFLKMDFVFLKCSSLAFIL